MKGIMSNTLCEQCRNKASPLHLNTLCKTCKEKFGKGEDWYKREKGRI